MRKTEPEIMVKMKDGKLYRGKKGDFEGGMLCVFDPDELYDDPHGKFPGFLGKEIDDFQSTMREGGDPLEFIMIPVADIKLVAGIKKDKKED